MRDLSLSRRATITHPAYTETTDVEGFPNRLPTGTKSEGLYGCWKAVRYVDFWKQEERYMDLGNEN